MPANSKVMVTRLRPKDKEDCSDWIDKRTLRRCVAASHAGSSCPCRRSVLSVAPTRLVDDAQFVEKPPLLLHTASFSHHFHISDSLSFLTCILGYLSSPAGYLSTYRLAGSDIDKAVELPVTRPADPRIHRLTH